MLIFFKSVLLAIALIKFTVNGASGGDEFVLRQKSFTIKSTITSFNYGLIDLGTVHLTETYSKEFRRARLDYKPKDSVSDEEFYYDPKVGGGITFSKIFKTCSHVPLSVLYYNINFNSEEMKSLFKLAESNNEDLNYIIGPSKLLFLLANHVDDMEVILNPNEDEDDEKKRGHLVTQYKLELRIDQNRKVEFNLFYDKTSYSGQQSLRSTIPLQVCITFSNSKVYYIIDYYSREIFSQGNLIHARFDLADKNSLILFDQFAYPTSFECNRFLDESNSGNLFETYDLTSIRYSFVAKSKPLLGRMLQHFVAFDGMASVLRIDTKRTDPKQEQTGDDENRDYIQVIDFRTNRKYTYVDNPRLKDDGNQQSKLLFPLLGDKSSHCSVMYADEPEKSQRDSWSLSKLLTGADKFTFMGYGQVRGVDALIYEGKSESVPYWFSQPMLFKDKNNNFRFKKLGDMIKQDVTRQIKYEYSVVFYIANNEEEIIKPLLLEYYDLRIDSSSDYRRSLVIRFNNFIWDLNDSFNGDSPIELFSLKDYCSSGSGDDKYAQVDLLLEEDSTMRKEEEEKEKEKDRKDSIDDWISNNILRNEALISAFRYVMEIQSVMLYDLQSKVFKQDNKHKILASFRVAEHPTNVYHLTFIGNAELNKEHLDSMLIVHSLTLTECLWLVEEFQKPTYIHYSQLSSSCIIDKQLSESSSVDIRDSKLFILKDQVVGELYRVESHYDAETSFKNSWLREANFNQLENRQMILQSNQQGDPVQPINANDLKMRIKKVKIDNVNFMNRIGNQDNTRQIKPPSRVYPGFTLPIQDEQTKVFKLKNSNNIKKKFLSQEQCHAACLADLNCKSFSYCVQQPDIVCILSTVAFEAPGIREHLESRDVQNLARGSKVLIKTMHSSIEIIRDFRCQLYNKNYIDLFTRSKGGMYQLKNLIIIPVNNEEDCAKMCFAESLETIKLSVELGKNIKTLLLEEAQDNSDDEDKDSINQRRDEYLAISSKFCKFFLFLDTTLSVEERQIIKLATEESHKNVESNNYCAINGLPNRGNVINEKLNSAKLLFNNYKFQFKSLYEKRYGYILKRSNLNEKEEEAYKNVIQQKQLELDQYELLKNSLSEGKNFQKELNFDADICAYECFLQHSGLWPACRSFDIMTVSYKWDNTVGLDNLCYLNSEVDSQNQYSPANLDSKLRSIQAWHYMPRFGVISEEGDDYFDLGALDERNNFKEKETSKIGQIFKVISNISIITLLLSFGVICGLFIGFKLTERFVRGKLTDRMPDRVMLSPNL